VNPQASKITSQALADLYEVSVDTIDRWAREHESLKACHFRRGWWDVRKLRANGWLLNADEVAHA
jgi:hypothetical protein